MHGRSGISLIESLVVLSLLGIAAAIVLPSAATMISGARAAAGARQMAMALHAQRWTSVTRNARHGLYFVQDSNGWLWYEVRDGNGNGLRTAEIEDGTDETLAGPRRLEWIVNDVTLGFPAAGPIPRIPPGTGYLSGLDDPVKFGASNIVSFSPFGSASSGTIYVTGGDDTLYGVLLFGPTARVRVWRFDVSTSRWSL